MSEFNIAVVAAGRATRLGKFCENIPKCLLSFGGKTAIERMLEMLPYKDAKEIAVVVSPDFRGRLLKRFLRAKYPGVPFNFVVQEKPIGTADAVRRALGVLECKLPVLITWSDIIPKEPIVIPDDNTVFTSDDFPCRYSFGDGHVVKSDAGGVIGMFHLKSIDDEFIMPALATHKKQDFADVLELIGSEWREKRISCYDFGVEQTLKQTAVELDTSAYATLVRHGCEMVKTYNELGEELFTKEITWYAHVPDSMKRFIPQIVAIDMDTRSIRMKFVDGKAVDPKTPDEMKDFLAHVVYVLSEHLHSNTYPVSVTSLYKEYVEIPLERSKFLYDVVPGLADDVIVINGDGYDNPVKMLSKPFIAEAIVQLLAPLSFSFIHGDPTLQNMKIGDHVYLFDPKVKFGDLWMFGDPKYDFAKIYYSFVGNYDGFNAGEYELKATGNGKASFEYSVKDGRFSCVGDWYLDYLKKLYNVQPVAIRLIHALIWMRLTGYILPKSMEQAIVAFLHGTVLFNDVVKELGWCESKL
jgi:GTP:adenosylcobinamide-phosphate guanylyltransferase